MKSSRKFSEDKNEHEVLEKILQLVSVHFLKFTFTSFFRVLSIFAILIILILLMQALQKSKRKKCAFRLFSFPSAVVLRQTVMEIPLGGSHGTAQTLGQASRTLTAAEKVREHMLRI